MCVCVYLCVYVYIYIYIYIYGGCVRACLCACVRVNGCVLKHRRPWMIFGLLVNLLIWAFMMSSHILNSHGGTPLETYFQINACGQHTNIENGSNKHWFVINPIHHDISRFIFHWYSVETGFSRSGHKNLTVDFTRHHNASHKYLIDD